MIDKKIGILLLAALFVCFLLAGTVCGAERTFRFTVSGCES